MKSEAEEALKDRVIGGLEGNKQAQEYFTKIEKMLKEKQGAVEKKNKEKLK